MTPRALTWLRCPTCRGTLALTVWREEDEIEEGRLDCGACGRGFPIVNGIPRLLPDELTDVVVSFHPDFFARYAAALGDVVARARGAGAQRQPERRTVKSYSYQWRKFRDLFPHWEDVFRWSVAPLSRAFLEGKVGVDAGCGFGRSLYYSTAWGAEMIGLDLSEAIEAARDNLRGRTGVHLVQGDILNPPIAEGSVDFVYSIGVLQHLSDPPRALRALRALIRDGGPLALWVYPRGRGRQIAAWAVLRAATRRLPLRAMDALCLGIAAAHWLMWIAPYRMLHAAGLARVANAMPFTYYARYPFRVLHTDWLDGMSVPLVDYYRPEQVRGWLREAGLETVEIADDWQGRALGWTRAPAAREPR